MLKYYTAHFDEHAPATFGFNHLKSSTYSLRVQLNTTFNVTDLLKDQIMWNTNEAFHLHSFSQGLTTVDKVFIDGTRDYDDMELPIHSLHSLGMQLKIAPEGPLEAQVSNKIFDTLASKPMKVVVLTSRTNKDELLAEIKDYVVCANQTQFDLALKWLAKTRHESEAFSALKSVVESISPDPIRSMVAVDNFIINEWTTKYLTASKVRMVDCLPFSDSEIVSYFVQNLGQYNIHFMDQRWFENASPTKIIDIDKNTVIKLGKTVEPINVSFLVAGTNSKKPEKPKAICFIKLTDNLSKIDVRCVNNIVVKPPTKKGSILRTTAGTLGGSVSLSSYASIDMQMGVETCLTIKKTLAPDSEEDIPGRITNIDGELLDKCYAEITRKSLAALNFSIDNICLIPIVNEAEMSDWTQTFVKKVPIKYTNMQTYTFKTFIANLPSLTHGDIDTLERTIVRSTIHEDSNYKWEFVNKSNGPKLEQRKEEIAAKLAFIEEFLTPIIQFHIKMSLGFPAIPRGYIVYNNTSNANGAVAAGEVVAGMVNPFAKDSGKVRISPNLNAIPYIAYAKALAGSFENLEEAARELIRNKSANSEPFNSDVIFMNSLYRELCKKNNKAPQEIKKIVVDDKPTSEPVIFKFNTKQGKVMFDMSCLAHYCIGSILYQSVLLSMVENDTFINTDIPTGQLISSENRIMSVLRDNMISEIQILKSIYG